jgi:hypothetical protein
MTTYLLTNQKKGGGNVELLNLIPYGKENAISRKDLSKLTGWDDRRVRDEIKRLMRNGERILSSSSAKGYWRSDDPDEIERFLKESDNRRRTEALNVEPLRFFVAKSKGEDFISVRAHYRRIHKQASSKTDIQGGE